MTPRSISMTSLALSALVFTASMANAADLAEQYQVAPGVRTATTRSALLAVRPAGDTDVANSAVDARLSNFAAANAANPGVQSALEQAALAINSDPTRFINDDGSTNKKAMSDLLTTQFGQAGQLVMPQVKPDYNIGNAGVSSAGTISGMGDADIMALAFIVMMEASKSAREDLNSVMAAVKASNQKKQALRETSDRLDQLAGDCAANPENCNGTGIAPGVLVVEPQGQVSMQDIDNAKETVKSKLDSLSEMGETESLRLQMAMDRLSKLMSTLSNVLKKQSETSDGIIQNIK